MATEYLILATNLALKKRNMTRIFMPTVGVIPGFDCA